MSQSRSYRYLAGVVLVSALLVSGALVVNQSSTKASAQTQPSSGKTVSVSATGEVDAQPDKAVLRVSSVARADDSQTARDRLAENVTSMREALREIGIEDDQIRTTDYRIDERTPRVVPPREKTDEPETEYYARHGFEIEMSDLDAVGEVIDTAVDNGATDIDGARYTLSDSTRRTVRNEALTEAMENAQSQAETLADAGEISITGVHSVRTSESRFIPRESMMLQSGGDAGGASTTLESGPVTVTANVDVVYNATG
ncbi:SIMPL domain-containing protein [Halorutilales archaeon Cl-col2-1]